MRKFEYSYSQRFPHIYEANENAISIAVILNTEPEYSNYDDDLNDFNYARIDDDELPTPITQLGTKNVQDLLKTVLESELQDAKVDVFTSATVSADEYDCIIYAVRSNAVIANYISGVRVRRDISDYYQSNKDNGTMFIFLKDYKDLFKKKYVKSSMADFRHWMDVNIDVNWNTRNRIYIGTLTEKNLKSIDFHLYY